MHFHCGYKEATEKAHSYCSPQEVDFFFQHCPSFYMHESHIPFSIVPQGSESLSQAGSAQKHDISSSVLEQDVFNLQMQLIDE